MADKIVIDFDGSKIQAALDAYPKEIPKIAERVINTAIRQVRKDVLKSFKADYTPTGRFPLSRVGRVKKAKRGDLTASVSFSGRMTSGKRFGARNVNAGGARFRLGGRTAKLEQGRVVRFRNGGSALFDFKDTPKSVRGLKRLKQIGRGSSSTRRFGGPSFRGHHLANRDRIQQQANKQTQEQLQIQLQAAIDRLSR